MHWLAIEHSPGSYRADFYLYGTVALTLGAALLLFAPRELRLLGWGVVGASSWTLLEYLLHRFVLHALPPFKRWHAEHHRRPGLLIAAPTLLTAILFSALLLPAIWCMGRWPAAALSFGLLGGYLAYGLIHHAVHRRIGPKATSIGGRWLLRRRLWHGLHHRRVPLVHDGQAWSASEGYYGVSSAFWDHVFGTARRGTSSACRSPPSSRT